MPPPQKCKIVTGLGGLFANFSTAVFDCGSRRQFAIRLGGLPGFLHCVTERLFLLPVMAGQKSMV
jgi:hypothetical protein